MACQNFDMHKYYNYLCQHTAFNTAFLSVEALSMLKSSYYGYIVCFFLTLFMNGTKICIVLVVIVRDLIFKIFMKERSYCDQCCSTLSKYLFTSFYPKTNAFVILRIFYCCFSMNLFYLASEYKYMYNELYFLKCLFIALVYFFNLFFPLV